MTPTFVCLFYDVSTTPLCPGCGIGTKLRQHNFVVVPRFTTRVDGTWEICTLLTRDSCFLRAIWFPSPFEAAETCTENGFNHSLTD